MVRGWGTIVRKAAGPVGYWLVLGLITFLGMNAVIKIEAARTRLFLVVVVIGVAFGAASLVEHLLRDYVPTDMQPNGEPTGVWPRWYRRSPHAMTLRQQIRIRFAILKKALQLRRPLTETEMHQVVAAPEPQPTPKNPRNDVMDRDDVAFPDPNEIASHAIAFARMMFAHTEFERGIRSLEQTDPKLREDFLALKAAWLKLARLRETDLSDRIRERAYEIWIASGYRSGEAEQHWLAAEREILSALEREILSALQSTKSSVDFRPATKREAEED